MGRGVDGDMVDTDETGKDLASDLIDLSGVTLEAVAALPESALAVALRRILREAAEGSDSFSNEYIEAPMSASD